MQDLEEIRKITGVCPQFNVQFDTLTVKENLRLFAKINRPFGKINRLFTSMNEPFRRLKSAKKR